MNDKKLLFWVSLGIATDISIPNINQMIIVKTFELCPLLIDPVLIMRLWDWKISPNTLFYFSIKQSSLVGINLT